MLALQNLGYPLLLPFGENTRYDLVIDHGERFERVQCKTGRFRNGAVIFATTSTYLHHKNPVAPRRPYTGQIDSFAVYCIETGGVYLIPIAELPNRTAATLRATTPLNGQRALVRLACDYEIARIPLESVRPP